MWRGKTQGWTGENGALDVARCGLFPTPCRGRIDRSGIPAHRSHRDRIRRQGILHDHLEKNFNSSRANPTQNQTPQTADLFAAARPATFYSKTDKIVSNWANDRLVRSRFRDQSARHALSHSLWAPIVPRAVDYRNQLKTRLKSHTPENQNGLNPRP